jgi:hypothetical protein
MQAVRQALHSVPFLVMAGAYFVCGMQLVFLTSILVNGQCATGLPLSTRR